MFNRICPLKEASSSSSRFGSLSLSDLNRLADSLTENLQKKGIRPGNRIAVLYPPSPELAALFFAAWRLGASLCPLSLRLPKLQIKAYLDLLKPALFIDSFPIQNTVQQNDHLMPAPGVLLFTSGSTNVPKIAFLSLSNLLTNALGAVNFFHLQEKSRWLLNLPLYHVGGLGVLLRCMLAKASCSLDPSDPEITHVSAVPTQLYRATPIYKNLQCLLLGGAPIYTYPKLLPCYVSYGLTEMGSLVTAQLRPKKPNQTGHLLPDRELRITPDGEIEVRGKCLFEGYWNAGKLWLDLDSEGWFATRDLGSYGSNGLVVKGRKDWQFISGGENIQPEEVEQWLLSIPGVIEAVVLPKEDPEFGHLPAACLKVADSSLTEEKIKNILLDVLPKFKIPKHYFFLREIPKNGLKLDRKECRKYLLHNT